MDRRKALRKTGILAGVTLLTPSLLTLLQSCKSEPRISWKPQFFTNDEAACISALVDTLLPRTATPGALDVKVDLFIDKVVAQTYEPDAQENLRKEIKAFNETCKKDFGDAFAQLDAEKRKAALQAMEKQSPKFNGSIWGATIGTQEPIGFYRSMKATAISAYFSAEEIGEKVLNYDPLPGAYNGCIPLSEVGNRWSL